ncbi:MAG TPA: YIP1 family protein [Longimicrobium sp.]|nr:YIP1 family protein [Longimicrobium sp.]
MEYPAGGFPPQRSLVQRMIGAAMLDASVYEEVEHDQGATGQAVVVVTIVALCAGIGSWAAGGHSIAATVSALVSGFLTWIVMSGMTYVVGTKLFGGTADMGEMMRTLGFSRTPGVLAALAFVPVLGPLLVAVAWIWQLVTAVVAIRQALDFDTGKAIATALIAWIASLLIAGLLAMFLVGSAFAVGAVVR